MEPAHKTLGLEEWLNVVSPHWSWNIPHLVAIQKKLREVTEGRCRRLMIFCPPRHGKSEETTIRYPVWRMEQSRGTRVCVGCYNQRFAERFGRRSRRIAEARGIVSKDRAASMEWETPEGGVYRSCGVGSPPTGEGFDLIVIDDPVKSREEAESEAYRERAWEWYQDLYTRQEPGAAMVVIQTRWHEDDLAGRLLAEGEPWEVLNLPALAESGDALGRPLGAALWPERFPAEELGNIRKVLGTYAFESLYQQNPTAREGAIFKIGMLQYADAAPKGLRLCRAWDLAATPGGGDYSAGVLMGTDGARFYVLDVRRGQWASDHRNAEMRAAAALDGVECRIRLAQDPGQAGKDQAQSLSAMLAGNSLTARCVTGDKTTRADPFASQVNIGNVTIINGDWKRAFVEELRSFPMGKHDDQVDAAADAFTDLASAIEPDFS